VPTRKNQHIPSNPTDSTYHPVRPCGDLIRRFTSRAAVAKQLPSGPLRENIRRAESLILAVVPFDQIAIDFVRPSEARQFACADRTLQGARKHFGESEPPELLPKAAGVALASLRQGQVRQPGVLTRQGPGGLAVASQIN
jgi:hypothetical protein